MQKNKGPFNAAALIGGLLGFVMATGHRLTPSGIPTGRRRSISATLLVQKHFGWSRRSESGVLSVVFELKMLDFTDETGITPPLSDPAPTVHLC